MNAEIVYQITSAGDGGFALERVLRVTFSGDDVRDIDRTRVATLANIYEASLLKQYIDDGHKIEAVY